MIKHYVLDTNVLLTDAQAIHNLINGEENQIYIPLAVLYELDKLKKDKPVLVNQAIDQLEEYKESIEILNTDLDVSGHVDTDILNSTKYYNKYYDLVLITNDRLMRLLAYFAYSVTAQEYIKSSPEKILVEQQSESFEYIKGKLCFEKKLVKIDDCWGIIPKSESQKMLMYSILNPNKKIITVNSKAGMGKTFITLACSLYLAFEKKSYKKIKITRPLVSSGQDIGHLPGDLNEKILNYFYPVIDVLHELNDVRKISKLYKEDGVINPKKIELVPTNYLRGANFSNCILVVDEAQNLSRAEIRTLLTRCKSNCKVILLGDICQVDAHYLNKTNNALSWCVDKLSSYDLFIHHILEGKNMRGDICDMILTSGL